MTKNAEISGTAQRASAKNCAAGRPVVKSALASHRIAATKKLTNHGVVAYTEGSRFTNAAVRRSVRKALQAA